MKEGLLRSERLRERTTIGLANEIGFTNGSSLKMTELITDAALTAEKWRREQEWEEARLDIARQELAKKPSKWLPTASLAATIIVALLATTATSYNLRQSRLETLQDEQRKAIQANVTEYVGLLLNALTAAQEISSNAVLLDVEPTPQQWSDYDREQRRRISDLHLAGAKVLMESQDVFDALNAVYRQFCIWDEQLVAMRTSDARSANRKAYWKRVDDGLLQVAPIPTLSLIHI